MCKRNRISVSVILLLSLASGGSALGDSTTITYTGEAGGICATSEDQTVDVGSMLEGQSFTTSIGLVCNTDFNFSTSSSTSQALVHSDFEQGESPITSSGHRLTAPYTLLTDPSEGTESPPFDGDIEVTITFKNRNEPLLAGDYSGTVTVSVNPK